MVAQKTTRLGVILSAVAGIVFVPAASAQSTRDRLDDLTQRMERVERRQSSINDSQAEVLRKLRELETETQALRNEIETLQFETVQSGDRQRQLYLDLDQRMQMLEAGGGARAGAEAPISVMGGSAQLGESGGGAGGDQQAYQAAFNLLKEGRYAEASTAFENFLATYTNSQLRDNAQYWLAETRYVSQDFVTALDGFQQVVSGYPTSRKIPDAWLKIGYCNYELQRWNEARQALSVVTARFPETTAAKLARERLDQMQAEGR